MGCGVAGSRRRRGAHSWIFTGPIFRPLYRSIHRCNMDEGIYMENRIFVFHCHGLRIRPFDPRGFRYAFLVFRKRGGALQNHASSRIGNNRCDSFGVITYALVVAGTERNVQGELAMHSGFLGRVSDLPIPADIEDILRKGQLLEIRSTGRKIRTGQSGLSLQPFEYKFPHQSKFARGIVAAGEPEQLDR